MPNTPLHIPLINPNEIEAQVTAIHIREGQRVAQGDPICSLETTKSSFEITAPHDGYVVGIQARTGQRVIANDIFCYVAELPDWLPPENPVQASAEPAAEVPAGIRITQPALILAHQNKIDLQLFSTEHLITEKLVQAELNKRDQSEITLPQGEFAPTDIVVYGGGGHGKAILELVR